MTQKYNDVSSETTPVGRTVGCPAHTAQPAAQAHLPVLESIPVDQLLQIIGALQMIQS